MNETELNFTAKAENFLGKTNSHYRMITSCPNFKREGVIVRARREKIDYHHQQLYFFQKKEDAVAFGCPEDLNPKGDDQCLCQCRTWIPMSKVKNLQKYKYGQTLNAGINILPSGAKDYKESLPNEKDIILFHQIDETAAWDSTVGEHGGLALYISKEDAKKDGAHESIVDYGDDREYEHPAQKGNEKGKVRDPTKCDMAALRYNWLILDFGKQTKTICRAMTVVGREGGYRPRRKSTRRKSTRRKSSRRRNTRRR